MSFQYDVIIIGGGLAGSALGKALSEYGLKILILEREKVFRDRVRGEYVHPWGVTEIRSLGIYDLLMKTCAHEARFRVNQLFNAPPAKLRDMVETSPHHIGSLHFYHPEMQEVLLQAAHQSGVTVERGAVVSQVLPGPTPNVTVQEVGGTRTYQARLVVGADGRTSMCRKWGGFSVKHDPDRMVFAGLLLYGVAAPEGIVHTYINPLRSEVSFLIPLGDGRFRAYAGYYQQAGRQRLSGKKALQEFLQACVSSGAPPEWVANAVAAGPLASFDGADTWVPHPYNTGITLIGDAASSSDPCFGCGLSLALRDVRVLRDWLLKENDWDAGGRCYANEHDQYYGSIHRLTDWLTRLFYEPGDEAQKRREVAFRRIAEDPSRVPDLPGLGPEFPSDEAAHRNLFGEEELMPGLSS